MKRFIPAQSYKWYILHSFV